MHKKTKGSIAELHVCADLMKKGWRISIPYGENNRYDLVAEKDGKFLRIQVKYVTPKNGALYLHCFSSNNWSVQRYTSVQIDVIAAYNPLTEKVYYVPVDYMQSKVMLLRLTPARNGQKAKIRYAHEFEGHGVVCDRAGTQAAKGDRL